MQSRTLFVSGLLAAGLSFGTVAQGQLVQTINIHLTAHITTSNTTNGTTHVEKMKSVRLSTREILSMLAAATSNDFKNATLVTVNRGESYQVRRGTNVLADVSAFFTFGDFSQDVIDQNFDSSTGKDFYHGFWLSGLGFDDHRGNSFSLNGIIEERFLGKTADAQEMQMVSDTENFSGSGTGTLNGEFDLLNGTILLSGKGTVPKDTF
jgi:hypothetical protein